MHVDFDPQGVDWTIFSPSSTGDAIQEGGGAPTIMMMGSGFANYPVFSGMPYQRGAGIGSVLRSLWRVLLPIGRQIGAAVGRQGIESGARVLSGLADGQNLKETVQNEGRAGLKNLLDKASETLARQKGSGGGSFDFKHYKRKLEKGCVSDNVNDEQSGIKRRLLATIGPSEKIPSLAIKLPKRKINSRRPKKARVDAFGSY